MFNIIKTILEIISLVVTTLHQNGYISKTQKDNIGTKISDTHSVSDNHFNSSEKSDNQNNLAT